MTPGLVLDSSALLAILFGEPEQNAFLDLIFDTAERRISAFSILPFTAEHMRLARQAWERFGKGRHPAALNLGDCCSYALARATGAPLLFKGNDFPQTDLELIRL